MMKRFLADFINDREDAEEHTVFLTTNYRCAGSILEAAAGLIRHNKNRIDKDFRKGSSLQGAFPASPSPTAGWNTGLWQKSLHR